MDRKEFLTEFLGALGAVKLTYFSVDPDTLTGRVHYDPSEVGSDPDEDDFYQDFCWHMMETNVPGIDVFNLAKLLNAHKLLDIDKIKVPRTELRELFNAEYAIGYDQHKFDRILEELKKVIVNMVDDGEETDIFFIHE